MGEEQRLTKEKPPIPRTKNCDQTDLTMLQWGTRKLTNFIKKPEYVRSYLNLNSSLLFHYEANYFDSKVEFEMDEIRDLLEFDMDNGLQKGAKSLLNFENAKFLENNLNDPQKLADYFLKTDTRPNPAKEKGEALAKYYDGILKAFKQYTKDPVNDYYKSRFARDSIQKSLYMLYAFGFNNVTSKAFQDVYRQNSNRFSCRDYFNKFKDNKAD